MIKSLKINNFRCFKQHEIRFNNVNVAVGMNNAGKTTVAEALRIVSIVAQRYRHIFVYNKPPDWLAVPRYLVGIKVSLRNLEINFKTIIHRYGDPPAVIIADFGIKGKIKVYIGGEDKVHCVIYDGGGKIAKSKSSANSINIPQIEILPQVGPVLFDEKILTFEYVKNALLEVHGVGPNHPTVITD